MGYLRPKSGLRKKNVYFGLESKIATQNMNFIGIEIQPLICYINTRNKNEIKNGLQSSKQ